MEKHQKCVYQPVNTLIYNMDVFILNIKRSKISPHYKFNVTDGGKFVSNPHLLMTVRRAVRSSFRNAFPSVSLDHTQILAENSSYFKL